jgi:hypothetical protein
VNLNEYLTAERQHIADMQRHVLANGPIDNRADMRTFCRLEGRMEQLLLIEAWIAAQARETVST